MRIVSSVVATLILLPRLDIKLPGGSFDGSHKKYLGVVETWRLQLEYFMICAHDEEVENKDSGSAAVATDTTLALDVSAGGTSKVQEPNAGFELSETVSLNPARNSVIQRSLESKSNEKLK